MNAFGPRLRQRALQQCPHPFGALQTQYGDALNGKIFDRLHTLSHAPPVCDGAGLALVGTGSLGSNPRARIIAFAESGGDPEASLTAGFAAMPKVLARAITIAKFLRDYPVDPAKVNVSGGHIAKGHPMGASGAILASTVLDCLDHSGGTLGLVVVSGASGVGEAMIVERLN